MNGHIWLAWTFIGLLAIMSIVLLLGKGAFLIAGYNTASKEKREKYDEKKLCRVMGSGFGIITIILAISTVYDYELPSNMNWLFPWGIITTLGIMIVLANSLCLKKK